MPRLLNVILLTAISALKTHQALALENLALRQQLAILRQRTKRPRITNVDRAFWTILSRVWSGWRRALVVVKPETVIAWHRKGFKLYWRRKSLGQKRVGRPRVDTQCRHLIRQMATEKSDLGSSADSRRVAQARV